ncbi:hypothetical protein WJX82_010836 [Trebouxia sp. C0006]
MDSQLEAVRQDIRDVKDEIVEVKQKVAAAEDAHNAEREQSHFNLLLSLNQQLSGLQEKENILLRSQAPRKHDPDSMKEQAPLKKARTAGREEIAARANKKLPSPSSFAKPSGEGGWTHPKLRELQQYMCFHRSPHDIDTQTTPVVLLDPILAQLLEDEFNVTFQRAKYHKAETGGSFIHLGGMLVNIEVKNEIGSGGGAIHVQNAAYAAAHAFQAKKVRGKSVCPTLLIELAGPNMSLSGAVYTDMALCGQLSPMVSLLWQPHSRLMVQAARCFAAIRNALPSLRSFYEALDQQALEQQEPTRQLEYPYKTSFVGPHGTAQHLLYHEKLSRTCFKATLDSQEGLVLVKFCKSYSKDAHTCLSSHGKAVILSNNARTQLKREDPEYRAHEAAPQCNAAKKPRSLRTGCDGARQYWG